MLTVVAICSSTSSLMKRVSLSGGMSKIRCVKPGGRYGLVGTMRGNAGGGSGPKPDAAGGVSTTGCGTAIRLAMICGCGLGCTSGSGGTSGGGSLVIGIVFAGCQGK